MINAERATLVAAAGIAYGTAVELTALPRTGEVLRVAVREDPSLNDMVTGQLVLSRVANPTAATPDEDIAWRSPSTGFTGDAITASLDVDLTKAYAARGPRLWAVLNVTAIGGGGPSTSVVLDVTVRGG